MPLAAELRTLWHLARGSRMADSHAARLEAFYAPQAADYVRRAEAPDSAPGYGVPGDRRQSLGSGGAPG